MRLGAFWGSSAGANRLEAILLALLDAPASSSYPPNRLLEPPPGGRNTLELGLEPVSRPWNMFVEVMVVLL